MSKVFVVHHPTRWEIRERCMVPLDLSPAALFGELVFALPGLDRPAPAQEVLPELRRVFGSYTAGDYLVIAGNIDLLVWASMLAFKAAGKVNLLRFDGRQRRYEVCTSPDGLLGESRT